MGRVNCGATFLGPRVYRPVGYANVGWVEEQPGTDLDVPYRDLSIEYGRYQHASCRVLCGWFTQCPISLALGPSPRLHHYCIVSTATNDKNSALPYMFIHEVPWRGRYIQTTLTHSKRGYIETADGNTGRTHRGISTRTDSRPAFLVLSFHRCGISTVLYTCLSCHSSM